VSILQQGARPPPLTLTTLRGEPFESDGKLTLAVFFKTTCPTCQYAWPFFERLYREYRDARFDMVGISQHDHSKTARYQREYRATFPHAVDADFHFSRQFDPPFVPTAFLIDEAGRIAQVVEAWDRDGINDLSLQIARRLGFAPREIVSKTENVLAFKPG
jgi:peroxiredoxin